MRRSSGWLALVLALSPLGCTQPGGRGGGGGTVDENDDAPRTRHESQLSESKASREIELAGKTEDVAARRRHYDIAVDELKHARSLYEDELAEEGRGVTVPLGRKRILESEVDRLTRAIEKTSRDRPLVNR